MNKTILFIMNKTDYCLIFEKIIILYKKLMNFLPQCIMNKIIKKNEDRKRELFYKYSMFFYELYEVV